MIRTGIGGWVYPDWRKGNFYPEGVTQKSELEWASRQLGAIEINGTYHSLQKPESFRKWREATPEGFVFAVKGSSYITNRKVLASAGEAMVKFYAQGLDELGDRLGPILWQLMAFNATVMAIRTDSVGSCGADNPQDPTTDCQFSDTDIANAINYASTNGAKVINISLGGEGASTAVRNAVAAAANRGTLMILSAGNDGAAQPESFASLLDQSAAGGVIIAGSVNDDGNISSFSNRAGTQNSHYMTALGNRVCCTYENGQLYVDNEGFVYVFSGTSFSAPQISGAAALLAQAFPNLTGRQIADILLRSAYDVGAPGTDVVYGHGILDIYQAFQPLGTTSLAGQSTSMALGDGTGAGSVAMGDALERVALPAIVLDEYKRAFEADLAGTLRSAEPASRLANAVGGSQREVSMGSAATSLAFSIDDRGRFGELRLGESEAEPARVLAARVAMKLAPDLKLGFGYAEGADGLVATLQGQDRPAFLIAPDASGDSGALRHTAASVAVRKQLGPCFDPCGCRALMTQVFPNPRLAMCSPAGCG